MPSKATAKNNLQTYNPTIAKGWHPTKNISVTPGDVAAFSGKKVWWLCSKGHEWETRISDRSNGSGCPYCSGHKADNENCLQTRNPSLAKEWHPTKNSLTTVDVTFSSHKKVWWLCSKGHEWQTTVDHRSRGQGCPYCSGHKVNTENCMQTVNPTLAREWHHTKNGTLTPIDVTAGSHKKAWWQCSRGHEWEATVKDRCCKGSGCPYCYSSTSQLELRVFTEMKFLFHDAEHRRKIHGVECDVFIPSINLAIEIDGAYFHKDKFEQDKFKTNVLKNENVDLIRIREKGLSKVSGHDILCKTTKIDFSLFSSLIQQILRLRLIDSDVKNRIRGYLTKAELANDQEYRRIWSMLPSPFPELSLEALKPSLAKEWHPTKNVNLHPIDVTVFSNKKVWWQCQKGHEWEGIVNHRSKGSGCPYCSGNKVSDENCLQTRNPSLAKEWHPIKNVGLTPRDVTAFSGKKAWWLCPKGHEWLAAVSNRSGGQGCPYCAGKRVNDENCLKTLKPSLAKEWHPTKNISLTAKDITVFSSKKVWWLCSQGHEWEAPVSDRSSNHGCPYCAGKRVSNENCLQKRNPSLAKEWHPTKNGSLTAMDVTFSSHRKVWWLCSKGHEWETTINSRSSGQGCPYCVGKKVNQENCLQTRNPLLAKEWHPMKNVNLTPIDLTAGSHKKVWWLCQKGHEWEATVNSRNRGQGCPYCYGQRRNHL